MNCLIIPLAAAAVILTYAASYHALKTIPAFGRPHVIAAIVALLSGLGLLSLGDGVVTFILIPYMALGLCLRFLLLYNWLMCSGAWRDIQRFFEDNTPWSHRPQPPSTQPLNREQEHSSGHLRGNQRTEE
jgi:hypothetical protein